MKQPIWIAVGLTVIALGSAFLLYNTVGPGGKPPPPKPKEPDPREVARQLLTKWPTLNAEARRKAVPDLIKALKLDDEDIRLGVVLAMDRAGPEMVRELAPLVQDPDDNTRFYAVWSLGRLGPLAGEAIPTVTDALKDKNGDVRRKAIWTLSQLKPSADRALPALRAAFDDSDIDVREAAADTVAGFGKTALPLLLETLKAPALEQRRLAVRAVGQVGPDAAEALPLLRGFLLDPDSGLQEETASALAQMDKEAIPVLTEALNTDDGPLVRQVLTGVGDVWAMAALWRDPGIPRRQAINALGKIGPDAMDVLLGALDNRYADVREQAAGVLGSLGYRDRRIVVAIADRLRDSNDSVRAQALWALTVLRPEPRVLLPELKLAIKDMNVEVRLQTVSFLSKLGAPVVPLLLEALRDKDARVQRQAVAALQGLDMDDEVLMNAVAPLLKDDDATVRQYAVGVLHRCGTPAVPLLMTALKDKSDPVRQQVVLALQDVSADEKELRPGLVEALKDTDPFVRAGAIGALTRFGTNSLPQLTAALTDESPLVRRTAVTALGRFDLKVAPQLIEVLKDDDPGVWEQAIASLVSLPGSDKKLMPLIVLALKHEDKGVRQGAAYVMKRFGADGVPALVEAVKDPEKSVQYAAVYALDDLGTAARKALPVLADTALNHADEKVRKMALKAMLKMNELDQHWDRPVQAVPGLIPLLEDRDATTRWTAAMTLAAIGPEAKDAVPALTKAAKDPVPNVAQTAQFALKRIQPGAE